MYIFNTDTAVKYWLPVLALTSSGECVCTTCSRTVVTDTTFGLPAVAAFLESNI